MRTMVQARINGVEAVQKSIAFKEKDLTRLKTELTARTKLLQDEIEKGGTTGDLLRDKVIRVYGLNDKLTEQYQALQNRLVGKRGQLVMVSYETEMRERFGGTVRESDFRHERRVRLGVLCSETLLLVSDTLGIHKNIGLPIVEYLQGTLDVWGEVSFEQGLVKDNIFAWSGDDRPPSLLEYMTDHASDIFIGDEAIKAEFSKRLVAPKTFATAAERLGRLILQPTE